MKLHRFLIDGSLDNSLVVSRETELISQLKNVLRLNNGDLVILVDGAGKEAEAEILRLDRGEVEFKIKEARVLANEPRHEIVLYCALLKRENFELVVQKATEIGVREIVPIITERTVKLGFARPRLEKIIKEAVEQSGRGFLPRLHDPLELERALAQAKENNNHNLIFDIDHQRRSSGLPISKNTHQVRVGLFVGPEGGWTSDELALAHRAGIKTASLGPLTFRAETAAIVASYLGAAGIL